MENMIREDTECWIEQEFNDCSTVMEVAYKYAEIRKMIDAMMEARLRILTDKEWWYERTRD